MILNIILLVLGFVILIKGADLFVDGASGIARNLKVSKMLVGLTVVAFGTSSPELAVGIKSIISGNGNVIGSNILNILLIIGTSALFHTLTVKNNTVKKELPITMLITTLFAVLMSDHVFDKTVKNAFTRSDGIILLLFFLVFIYYLISISKKKSNIETDENEKILSRTKSIIYTTLGLAGIIFGSNFVVDSASFVAKELGVTERLISLTIIALGTSLPELVTSITATRKGEYDIAIGNVVGSNIFNIGMVIGIPTSVIGGIGIINFSYIDIAVMIMASILLFMFSFNDYKISKKEGILFLIIFAMYYGYVIFS